MIQVRGLTKRFGSRIAVGNVTFDAPNGAITGLLGANGAGKTTTLRMIAGALRPDQGHIGVGNATLGPDNTAVQRCLGSLLDHSGMYGRLTARENIEYFGRLRGLDKQEMARNVERVLAMLGLNDLAERHVGEFSQGERMKVALGRALVHEPTHLLLDEPTNGLDVPTVRAFRDLLRTLRDSGCCILFSSHVLGDVQAVADWIVVIANGTVVACGSVEEICQRTGQSALEDAFLELIQNSGRALC